MSLQSEEHPNLHTNDTGNYKEQPSIQTRNYSVSEKFPWNSLRGILSRTTEIILTNNLTGQRVNLHQFLPEKFRFRRWNKFAANMTEKTLYYPSVEINNKGSLLSLLHEMGHAHQKETDEHYQMEYAKKFQQMDSEDVAELYVFEQLTIIQERYKASTLQDLNNPFIFTSNIEERFPLLTLPELDSAVEEIIRTERNAWARALLIGRKLKKEYGIDIFSDFKDFDDTKNYIDTCLNTYVEGIQILLAKKKHILNNLSLIKKIK